MRPLSTISVHYATLPGGVEARGSKDDGFQRVSSKSPKNPIPAEMVPATDRPAVDEPAAAAQEPAPQIDPWSKEGDYYKQAMDLGDDR